MSSRDHNTDRREGSRSLIVAGVQTHNRVGDLAGNSAQILDAMRWAAAERADLLVLPEMCLTGYPIGDLAFRGQFVAEARTALERLAAESGDVVTMVGCTDVVDPQRSWDTRERNVAIGQAVLWGGEIRGVYHKCMLPTYDVFDEARTFAAGREPGAVWRIGPALVGICVCEDLWSDDGPPEAQASAGAQLLVVPNGSPFYRGKPELRRRMVASVAQRTGLPVVYVNCVGGQDDLVFDGGSFAIDADGTELCSAAQFSHDRFLVEVPLAPEAPVHENVTTVHTRREERPRRSPQPRHVAPLDERAQVWSAIAMGLADFVSPNGFEGAAVALSGGVDSTVCLLAAVDALGAGRVLAAAMPAGPHQREELEDARELAQGAGAEFVVHDLAPLLALALERDAEHDRGDHVRLELEARARAMLLASLAAHRGLLPLATVNKTELALGAASVFGDALGGLAPLKDCPKTLVYELARWHQETHGLIPARSLERIASLHRRSGAELPPFEVLDPIVERYLNAEEDVAELVAEGFDPEVVRGVLQLVDDAEFKRRLAPLGIKITERAFGQDLRMPISSRWRPYQRQQEALVADSDGSELFEAGQALAG